MTTSLDRLIRTLAAAAAAAAAVSRCLSVSVSGAPPCLSVRLSSAFIEQRIMSSDNVTVNVVATPIESRPHAVARLLRGRFDDVLSCLWQWYQPYVHHTVPIATAADHSWPQLITVCRRSSYSPAVAIEQPTYQRRILNVLSVDYILSFCVGDFSKSLSQTCSTCCVKDWHFAAL